MSSLFWWIVSTTTILTICQKRSLWRFKCNCSMFGRYVRRGSSKFVIWLIHTCDMTHAHVQHGLFIYVTRLGTYELGTPTHRNTHITYCNPLQHTLNSQDSTRHTNWKHELIALKYTLYYTTTYAATQCNTDSLQRTATHTATHCNSNSLQLTATHCNTLQL